MIKTNVFVGRMKSKPNIQYLVRETKIGPFIINHKILDKEIIPDPVMITLGCFGDVGEWRSKFADVINRQLKSLEIIK